MWKYAVLLLVNLAFASFTTNAKSLSNSLTKRDMPKSAIFIIDNHFENSIISTITYKKREKNYLVKFKDGKKILFDAIGDWILIDCNKEQIPLLLVPGWIRNKIAKKYGPQAHAIIMQKVKNRIRIKLNNQVEIELK